jgi:hypothetical protein
VTEFIVLLGYLPRNVSSRQPFRDGRASLTAGRQSKPSFDRLAAPASFGRLLASGEWFRYFFFLFGAGAPVEFHPRGVKSSFSLDSPFTNLTERPSPSQ